MRGVLCTGGRAKGGTRSRGMSQRSGIGVFIGPQRDGTEAPGALEIVIDLRLREHFRLCTNSHERERGQQNQ